MPLQVLTLGDRFETIDARGRMPRKRGRTAMILAVRIMMTVRCDVLSQPVGAVVYHRVWSGMSKNAQIYG